MTVKIVGMLQRKGLNKLKRELLIPKPTDVISPIALSLIHGDFFYHTCPDRSVWVGHIGHIEHIVKYQLR